MTSFVVVSGAVDCEVPVFVAPSLIEAMRSCDSSARWEIEWGNGLLVSSRESEPRYFIFEVPSDLTEADAASARKHVPEFTVSGYVVLKDGEFYTDGKTPENAQAIAAMANEAYNSPRPS